MSDGDESTHVLWVSEQPDADDPIAGLEQHGFIVSNATSVTDGLTRLDNDNVECVVSEYELATQNGIEFLESVRERDPEIPFFVCLAEQNEEIATTAISSGATDYLLKRTVEHPELLANRIENAVNSYRTRQANQRRKERRKHQREALIELSGNENVINGNFEAAAERITEIAADVLDVERNNIWLLDEDNTVLSCVDHYDRGEDIHEGGMELPTEEYPEYVEALKTHRTLGADDALSDSRTACLSEYLEANNIPSLLDGTLRSEGDVIGVICNEPVGEMREWTEDERQFAGNLADTVHRALRNKREREKRQQELRDVSEGISERAADLHESIEQVADSSREISDLTDDQFETLATVGDEINRMSTVVEDIAATSDQVESTAEDANEVARSASETAKDTEKVMQEVNSSAESVAEDVDALRERVDEVDEVVDVIDDIADQVNMLALNASIEAARAGEAGTGFAVVADEVKTLAEESQQQAAEIEAIVASIKQDIETTINSLDTTNNHIRQGVSQVQQATEELDQIGETVEEAVVGIRQVSEATNEQDESTQQIATMIDEVVNQAEAVSAEVEDVAQVSQQQADKADEIHETISQLGE